VRVLLAVVLLAAAPCCAWADASSTDRDLTAIGLEDLMKLEVTSVSRKEEPLFRAASAVTVITAADIARSGAANIPDLLRAVPGLTVAQIDANTWAIGARGFASQYANKLLVLVDGRSVYNPLFSGVYWQLQNLMLEDIERIEVIRGSGGTIWGANAVNGVINIITKRAGDTQGTLAAASGSNTMPARGVARLGGRVAGAGDYRVYGKLDETDLLPSSFGDPGHDASLLGRAGGRFDWRRGTHEEGNVIADWYRGRVDERNTQPSANPPYFLLTDESAQLSGGDVVANWRHVGSARSAVDGRLYYNRDRRLARLMSEDIQTVDLDLHHNWKWAPRNELDWGGGYRVVTFHTAGTPSVHFAKDFQVTQLFSVFAQNALTLVPNRLTLTVGSKLEHNSFTGIEAEPSARLAFAPTPRQTLWAATSRAVRTPAPTDESATAALADFPVGGGTVGELRVVESNEMRSEVMTSGEVGYRVQPGPTWSFDVTAFRNVYDGLGALKPETPYFEPSSGLLVMPADLANSVRGETRGLEWTGKWEPQRRFSLTVSHSLFDINLHQSGPPDPTALTGEGSAARYQLVVQPHWEPVNGVSLDAALFHVDDRPAQLAAAYDRVDTRLAWASPMGMEFAVGAQNLFHDRKVEWGVPEGFRRSAQVRSTVFAKVTWKP
jgi:iron complex outermembrane receptor protein